MAVELAAEALVFAPSAVVPVDVIASAEKPMATALVVVAVESVPIPSAFVPVPVLVKPPPPPDAAAHTGTPDDRVRT
jgi:hypothetical protein